MTSSKKPIEYMTLYSVSQVAGASEFRARSMVAQGLLTPDAYAITSTGRRSPLFVVTPEAKRKWQKLALKS